MKNFLQTLITLSTSLFCFLFGRNLELILILIVFMALDYISGIISALINKSLNSKIGFKGIFKKLLMFLPVIIANLIDAHIINGTPVLVSVVVIFYSLNECLSILENLAKSGVPVPNKLKDVLAQLKEKNDDV